MTKPPSAYAVHPARQCPPAGQGAGDCPHGSWSCPVWFRIPSSRNIPSVEAGQHFFLLLLRQPVAGSCGCVSVCGRAWTNLDPPSHPPNKPHGRPSAPLSNRLCPASSGSARGAPEGFWASGTSRFCVSDPGNALLQKRERKEEFLLPLDPQRSRPWLDGARKQVTRTAMQERFHGNVHPGVKSASMDKCRQSRDGDAGLSSSVRSPDAAECGREPALALASPSQTERTKADVSHDAEASRPPMGGLLSRGWSPHGMALH
jgi:hypothetical protein